MATCRKCEEPIFWAWDRHHERWVPSDLETITGDEEEFEGGVIKAHWHKRHRCAGDPQRARPQPKSPPPAPPPVPGSPHATLYVTTNAPIEVIRAAHRALAAIHHPDVGGDHRRMSDINTAYERLAGKR